MKNQRDHPVSAKKTQVIEDKHEPMILEMKIIIDRLSSRMEMVEGKLKWHEKELTASEK